MQTLSAKTDNKMNILSKRKPCDSLLYRLSMYVFQSQRIQGFAFLICYYYALVSISLRRERLIAN